MADFCRDCHEDLFGQECTDHCFKEKLCKDDESLPILCEGCGEVIFVDCDGYKVSTNQYGFKGFKKT